MSVAVKKGLAAYILGHELNFSKFHLGVQSMRYFAISKLGPTQAGGAALEYVLVTTFALLTGVAALGFVGKAMQAKMEVMANRLGIDLEPIEWNPFADGQGR
jgi:hypothetical protein